MPVPPTAPAPEKSNLTFLAFVVGNFVLGFLSPSGDDTFVEVVAVTALPVQEAELPVTLIPQDPLAPVPVNVGE